MAEVRVKTPQSRPWAARRSWMGGLALATAFALPVGNADEEVPGSAHVQMVRLDGTVTDGAWMGTKGSQEIRLSAANGEVLVPCDDVSAVLFGSATARSATSPPSDGGTQAGRASDEMALDLADGGSLNGGIVGAAEDAVVARTALGESRAFPWNKLAGVRFAAPGAFRRAEELYRETLAARPPGQDVLISRDPVEVKILPGRLESLGRTGGTFVFSGESRTFQNERIYGIVFAAGAQAPKEYPVSVVLSDGSSFSGELEVSDERVLRAAVSVGGSAEIDVDRISELRFRSGRVTWLSDLQPTDQHVEGIVHAAWPVQRNRSVSGGPLSMLGRRFERGLGMHSRTSLTYATDAAFQKLAATIGIDDAVRPLGSVAIRVEGDGKVLLDAGEILGSESPRDIVVDVSGVNNLTLIVDYGEGLDVADHVDWGDARLIRPRGSGKSPGVPQP